MSDLQKRIEEDEGSMQKLAGYIPGFKGYRELGLRRKADQLVREHLVALLDDIRGALKGVISKWAEEGKLAQLDTLDRLLGKLTKARDNVRFADYGYTGWFDAVKIKEEQLDAMYGYDLQLRQEIMDIDRTIQALAAAGEEDLAAQLDAAGEQIAQLQHAIDHRGEITARLVP